MDKKEVLDVCLKLNDAVLSYPFEQKQYKSLPVMRHKSNNKWFALIFELESKLYINLKSNPADSAFLRDMYDFITPAWHMNKAHWIKVDINSAPRELLCSLIKESYNLTKK